jgi:hypothetical protein
LVEFDVCAQPHNVVTELGGVVEHLAAHAKKSLRNVLKPTAYFFSRTRPKTDFIAVKKATLVGVVRDISYDAGAEFKVDEGHLGNQTFKVNCFTIFFSGCQYLLFVICRVVGDMDPARVRDTHCIKLQYQLAELAVVFNPLGQIGVGNTGNLNICGKTLAMVRCCTAILP